MLFHSVGIADLVKRRGDELDGKQDTSQPGEGYPVLYPANLALQPHFIRLGLFV